VSNRGAGDATGDKARDVAGDAAGNTAIARDPVAAPRPLRPVLVVSYYFPPSGGPGVQRVLKFVRYLPASGYRPVVLTVPETAAFPLLDPSLAAEIPPEATVVRSPIREFYRLYRAAAGAVPSRGAENLVTTARPGEGLRERILHGLRAALFIPDGRVGWLPGGTRAGLRAIRAEGVEVILASGPPFTAHWIARRLADRTGLPLVLDFRDPWTRAPFYPRRPRLSRILDERLELSCLRRADAVLTVNRDIRDDLLVRHPGLDAARFHVVPNGYDPADFAGRTWAPGPDWTLTHTGTLPGNCFPAGFTGALRRLLAEDPEAAARLRIRMIGRRSPEMERRLSEPPLDRLVRFEGYLPHGESVRAIIESRLLLLFIEEGPRAAGILTGKLFEYLGSGAPVLALVPEGEAAELVRRTRAGRVVDGTDEEAVLAALREAVAAFCAGRRPFGEPERALVEEYARPGLTARLAAILDALPGPPG
jgi:glycosyltransferase involved in cell wall biosynthesis